MLREELSCVPEQPSASCVLLCGPATISRLVDVVISPTLAFRMLQCCAPGQNRSTVLFSDLLQSYTAKPRVFGGLRVAIPEIITEARHPTPRYHLWNLPRMRGTRVRCVMSTRCSGMAVCVLTPSNFKRLQCILTPFQLDPDSSRCLSRATLLPARAIWSAASTGSQPRLQWAFTCCQRDCPLLAILSYSPLDASHTGSL